MKRLSMVFGLLLLVAGCCPDVELSEKEYYHTIVKELSSDEYYGRSNYMNGDVRAAQYIINELKSMGVAPAPAATSEEVGLTPEYKSKIAPCDAGRWSGAPSEDIAYLQHFSFPMNVFRGDMEVVLDGDTLECSVDYTVKEFSSGANGEYDVVYIDNKYLTTKGLVKYLDSGKFKNSFVVLDWDYYQKNLEFHPFERYQPYLLPLKNVGGVILRSSSEELFPYFKARSYYTVGMPVLMVSSAFPKDAKKIYVDIENEFLPQQDAHNIMAYIPGKSNPEKCLMFSAHYDHLGVVGRENIFNGANDDASGVAMLLLLARHFQENRPDYSVMFLFTDAEEENLLGAFYYAENPRVPLENVFAYVEVDMIADNADEITYQISDEGREVLDLFLEVNKGMAEPFEALNPEDLNDDSDHYAFAQKNVPVFYISIDGDYHKYYHTPRDTYQNFSDDNFERYYQLLTGFSSKASSLYLK